MQDDWNTFVDKFGAMVYSSAWRILRHRQDAEDVAQDVFHFAWSRRHEGIRNVGGWLRHLAVCRAFDRLRKRRTVQLDEDFLPQPGNSLESLEYAELETLVRDAVGNLPIQQAAVFALRYFEYMNNREIAEHLSVSPSVVSSSLHAARKTLATLLKPIIQGDTE